LKDLDLGQEDNNNNIFRFTTCNKSIQLINIRTKQGDLEMKPNTTIFKKTKYNVIYTNICEKKLFKHILNTKI